jgi:hypothetical protein
MFVTAYNPYSVVTHDTINEQQQNELISLVTTLKLKYINGYSCDKFGNWKEPSLLVFGCNLHVAFSISKRFKQNAFIWMKFDNNDNDVQTSITPKLYLTR